jgi:hypothetical protein
MANGLCPYYRPEEKKCNISGVWQDNDYDRSTYCESGDKWKNCANYEGASDTTKIDCIVRR